MEKFGLYMGGMLFEYEGSASFIPRTSIKVFDKEMNNADTGLNIDAVAWIERPMIEADRASLLVNDFENRIIWKRPTKKVVPEKVLKQYNKAIEAQQVLAELMEDIFVGDCISVRIKKDSITFLDFKGKVIQKYHLYDGESERLKQALVKIGPKK
ncbi:unnamed protein product [marine sediment metagenome]|uniref:Uncharacterized protein n=1 Tax=marine sediment metagenome TaxID=412755 RepID=X0S9K7_9ZZZZ